MGATLLFVVTAACTSDDRNPVVPTGGAGGSSSGLGGDSGSAGQPAQMGGSGGSAGSGGSGGGDIPDDTGDAGPARFTATLQGATVRLVALDPVWLQACSPKGAGLLQQVNDDWVPLRDDRPEGFNLQHGAHVLDGAYQSDCRLSLGCDFDTCDPFTTSGESSFEFNLSLVAREYVQVGDVGVASCEDEDAGAVLDAGEDAGLRRVPNLETRSPSGPLRVRVRYYRDARCQTGIVTTDVAVEE